MSGILAAICSNRIGSAGVLLIVLAIILDIGALAASQWMNGYGFSFGLFGVCSSTGECLSYASSPQFGADTSASEDALKFVFSGFKTAASMLIMTIFLLVAAAVLLVLAMVKSNRIMALVASFLCIQSITFIGIGVGVYHNTIFVIPWNEPKPSVGGAFVLACLIPIVCFLAFAACVLAFRGIRDK